jgi:alkylation response protein AidB-like acyl-CoA dehydrogenase
VQFAFTDEQLAFRDAVRDFLAGECPPERVRAAWDSEAPAWPADLWSKLADLGVVGLTAPEAHGGLGLDELDLVLVLEETGRAALPAPIVETTAVGIPLLRDVGDERWLAPASAGAVVLTVGLDDQPLVTYAVEADVLLLTRGDEVHALTHDRVHTITPVRSVDGARPLARVEWEPGPDTRLAGGEAGRRAIAAAFDRGALAAAAQLVGVAAHLIDVTVAYAKERQQFGVPIGSFQAVKHHLANAYLKLDFARPVVYRAAYSLARNDARATLHVSMAKAYASDAAELAARVALQVHGAIGYAFEYDLHLWMKRAWALARAWGDAAFHRERVAAAVL